MLRYSSTVFNELIFKMLPYIKGRYTNPENSGTRKHIGDNVTEYINILEMLFFEDLASLPIAHIKKSDFQELREVFNWEKESGDVDHSKYRHEITQKIKIFYFPDKQDLTIVLEQPKIINREVWGVKAVNDSKG
jgi:hypothetical protein